MEVLEIKNDEEIAVASETEPELMEVTIEDENVVVCNMKRSHSDIHMERRIHQVGKRNFLCWY